MSPVHFPHAWSDSGFLLSLALCDVWGAVSESSSRGDLDVLTFVQTPVVAKETKWNAALNFLRHLSALSSVWHTGLKVNLINKKISKWVGAGSLTQVNFLKLSSPPEVTEMLSGCVILSWVIKVLVVSKLSVAVFFLPLLIFLTPHLCHPVAQM